MVKNIMSSWPFRRCQGYGGQVGQPCQRQGDVMLSFGVVAKCSTERASRTTTSCAGRGLFNKIFMPYLLSVFLCTTASLVAAQIKLEPKGLKAFSSTSSGDSFAAPLNESFTLKISVVEAEDKPGEISIAGLDNFRQLSSRTSSSIQFINGHRSATYNYDLELMPNGEGIFSLGPAMAKLDGEKIESNQLQMHVSRGTSRSKGQTGQQSDSKICFAKLEVSNPSPFVWESFMVTLRIWAHEEKVYDVQIEEPKG
jgi:hypothetical protein